MWLWVSSTVDMDIAYVFEKGCERICECGNGYFDVVLDVLVAEMDVGVSMDVGADVNEGGICSLPQRIWMSISIWILMWKWFRHSVTGMELDLEVEVEVEVKWSVSCTVSISTTDLGVVHDVCGCRHRPQ